jgi:hypothetical protein
MIPEYHAENSENWAHGVSSLFRVLCKTEGDLISNEVINRALLAIVKIRALPLTRPSSLLKSTPYAR